MYSKKRDNIHICLYVQRECGIHIKMLRTDPPGWGIGLEPALYIGHVRKNCSPEVAIIFTIKL